MGAGTSKPFDPKTDPSQGVGVGTDGALAITKKAKTGQYNKYLWVADTYLPGVVKIDLDTLKIVGRYRTGGTSTSRTTVNILGEAFIGSRAWGVTGKPGVTKILPQGKLCPDTNKDGVITTSSGPDDVLAWGQDDCVAWHTATDGDIRGLAAQDVTQQQQQTDVCKAFKGGGSPPPAKPSQHYLWIGGLHGKLYKLDASSGKVLLKVKAPSPIYGMALSGDGKLWTGKSLAFVDMNKCTDQATCEAAATCTQVCNKFSCPATCDNAVKARILGISGYGITVDHKKRVWMSSGLTKRYDPYKPANQRLATGPLSGSGGIAADADGWIWASNGIKTVRIDAETMQGVSIASPNKGVALDTQGRVFTIFSSGVHLIKPGKTLSSYTVTKNVVALKGFAYAYSDMTGVQTRLATDIPGWYRHAFEGCSAGKTNWKQLKWNVAVPAGTWAIFKVRSAATRAGLDSAAWRPVTCVASPGGVGSAVIDKQQGPFVEVEASFSAKSATNTTKAITAKVNSFGVSYSCGPVIK